VDTIYALASGRGRAGVAVVRISGPRSHEVLSVLSGPLPAMRRMARRNICWADEVLDDALVVAFAAGASFTGEESCELHLHGGQAVVAAVLRVLAGMAGLRYAEPGEFTRRALENGRLELFEVEGLADLIDAETEGQRRQAQKLLSGVFARRIAVWRDDLLVATALIEATVDFADEDVPVDVWPEVQQRLVHVRDDLAKEINGAQAAERVRNGFEIALYGPPNVGKSSLINYLAGRDIAMTSDIAGTTRDVLEVRLDIGGLPVVVLDTAGLRDSTDVLEQEGVRRGRDRLRSADMRILVLDRDSDGWTDTEIVPDLVVAAKSDLGWHPDGKMQISTHTGEGIDALLKWVEARLISAADTAGIVVHERHRLAVEKARDGLVECLDLIERTEPVEQISFVLRESRSFLDRMIGKHDVEEMLGAIFGRFCIGK
jgi:tRNA modification GTPase